MAEPTNTLAVLRREIARRLQMPFFLRYSAGYLEIDSSSTTSKIIDSALTQGDKKWDGSWYYHTSTQEVSKIYGFNSADNSFFLEVPLAATPSSGDDYEIHSIWNAIEIRQAINDAIRESGQTWFNSVNDESLILQENKLSYSISALSPTVWSLNKVFLENRPGASRGTVVSATSTTFTVENSSVFSPVVTAANWRVSIYAGTGAGQIRTLSTSSGAQGTVTVAWTTTPDTTSKYAFWDATKDMTDWIPIHNYRQDAKEYPDTIYLGGKMDSLLGMRIHLEYMALPSALSAEADTCIIPHNYVVPMAMSILYGNHLGKTKADKETYFAESQRLREMAERYMVGNAPHKPDTMLKSPAHKARYGLDNDPLGWGR